MSEISMELIKSLREKTGAGMMDCKKALTEAAGDLEQAVDWLRKKGLAMAAKKADRVATEGLVAALTEGSFGVVLEVNAETDFVSRNELFQNFVQELASVALKNRIDSLEKLPTQTLSASGGSVQDALTHLIATIGENMTLRRLATLSVDKGVVVSYVHAATVPNILGRIGVLVALTSEAPKDQLESLARQIAMHVAAASPTFLKIAEVDAASLQRERDVLMEQAQSTGRPADVIEKMVEGRIRKYYEEVVLEEQIFVVDGKRKITQVLEEASKTFGHPVTLTGFHRFNLGEGLEKAESNFAEEVQAQLK
ncbi:MAG: translation elongation factor Ts [Alphaproteobacteria bacterium]